MLDTMPVQPVVAAKRGRGRPAKYNWPSMIQLVLDLPVNAKPIKKLELREILGGVPDAVANEVIRRARIAASPECELAYVKGVDGWGYVLTDSKDDLTEYRNRGLRRARAALEATARTQGTLVRQYRGQGNKAAKGERSMAVLLNGLLQVVTDAADELEKTDFGL